ncbi:MAG: shikimate kinase [Proteobacteria bacterium]|nr:shikimate kinase [Pseudomonadota bacterium]
MNIILIGFMGCGKTSIGRRLASRLGYCFLDMDHQIVREQKKKVTDIFSEKGEAFFRQLETNLLIRLRSVNNTVIATGGGVIVTRGNMALIKSVGTCFFIDTDLEEIYKRVMRNTNRPLVHTANPRKTIEELYAKRIDLYREADIIIHPELYNKHRIVSQMIQHL